MTEPLFSPRAARELTDATTRIALDHPAAAREFVRLAEEAATRLRSSPGLGRPRPDYAPGRYRFWPLRGCPYLLVYDMEQEPIRVIRIVHTSRDLPRLFAKLAK